MESFHVMMALWATIEDMREALIVSITNDYLFRRERSASNHPDHSGTYTIGMGEDLDERWGATRI